MTDSKDTRKRPRTQLRPIRIRRGFTDYAGGSVLIEMGQTRVLCTACLTGDLPRWREEEGLGWVTAEYSMLPSSTPQRKARARSGHTDSRGTEIQRLIGRVMRAAVDFKKLGPNTIVLDCDVLQADGSTRTAAINGSYVALVDAVRAGMKAGLIEESPITAAVAAVSVGIVRGKAVLDLDYELDSTAEVDMNVAMTDKGQFLELQGTAEQAPFTTAQLEQMLTLARRGIKRILGLQTESLAKRRRGT